MSPETDSERDLLYGSTADKVRHIVDIRVLLKAKR